MRLKKLHITGGPLKDKTLEFTDVNLIYGLNESGKTHIVDAILQCLLAHYSKNSQKLGLYSLEKATLIIDYEENGNLKTEKLSKNNKNSFFQTYINQKVATTVSKGFSPEKLFIVRSADASLTENYGVDITVLSNFLAPAEKLNKIASGIQDTIKKVNLENLENIENKGRGQKYKELRSKIKEIEEALMSLLNFNSTELVEIINNIDSIQKELDQLEHAKHYLAYNLQKEIHDIKIQLKNFSNLDELSNALNNYVNEKEKNENVLSRFELEINSLNKELQQLTEQKNSLPDMTDEDVQNLQQLIHDHNKLTSEINSLEPVVKDYEEVKDNIIWLQNALDEYNQALLYNKNLMSFYILLGAPVILIIFSIFLFFFKSSFAILPLSIATLWLSYILVQRKKIFQTQIYFNKINEISQAFLNRFAIELKDSITLKTQLDKLEKSLPVLEMKKKQLEKLKSDLENIHQLIASSNLMKRYPDSDKSEAWNSILLNMKKELQTLKDLQDKTKATNFKIEQKVLEKKQVQNQIIQTNTSLETLKKEIQRLFATIGKTQVLPQEWDKTLVDMLVDMKNQKSQLEEHLNINIGKLKTLGIETPVPVDDPKITYDPVRYDGLIKQINSLKKERENLIEKANSIITNAQRIFQSSNVDPLLLYEDGLKTLENIENELNELIAEIIAGKIIFETIEEIKTQQKEQIQQVLASTSTAQYIFDITQKYNTISIVDSEVFISDENDEFPFKVLSTGTQEQILLAIRLGLIEHLFAHKPSFLVLDDAFQHSDYVRRPQIIRALFNLALKKWQIIYLTMDEHIRSLFCEISQKEFPQVNFIEHSIS